MRSRFLVAVFAAVLSMALAHPAAARDLALVIGNDAYRDVPVLQKAVSDAHGVAAALTKSGFVTTQAENLDQRAMSRVLAAFEGGLKPGDRALFYFSGHGFALEGANYLLPTDVPAPQGNQVGVIRDASFAVDRIVDGLRDHGAQVAILVLDACRNDPFVGPGTRGATLTRGLARIEAPQGVFVLMSASPRQAALDRLSDTDSDPNSVFTRTFLRQLGPGRTLVDIAKKTQVEVRELAASVGFEQVPAYSDQVVGDVVLNVPSVVAVTGPDDPLHVAPGVPTHINTMSNAQFGAGVGASLGVHIGPGVRIGGRYQGVPTPVAPPVSPPAQTATLEAGSLGSGVAPIAGFSRSNSGWTVTISAAEPATGLAYSLGDAGEFQATGLLDSLDPRTGQRIPNPSFQMSGKATATVIQVKYARLDGTTAGPFPIRFDPEVALYESDRKILSQLWPSWVEFRDFHGVLVYFTTIMSYRCAITEVRYGLDGAPPLTRFDMPPCDMRDPYGIPRSAETILRVPPKTRSIGLQITWRDGTRSDVNTIER